MSDPNWFRSAKRKKTDTERQKCQTTTHNLSTNKKTREHHPPPFMVIVLPKPSPMTASLAGRTSLHSH